MKPMGIAPCLSFLRKARGNSNLMMTPAKKLIRAFKVFVIATAVVFTVLNAPLLYTEMRYVISELMPSVDNRAEAADVPVLPIKLPVADYKEPALPDQATLVIDKIGVSVPIVFGVNENDLQDIYNNLNRGVVHYSATAKPGHKGTAVILGHSSDYAWKRNKYGTAFSLLGKLAQGDTFYVRYSDGRVFNFSVRQSLIYDPVNDDPSKLAFLEKGDTPTVLLMTCWPINSTSKRLIVQGVAN